MSPICESCRSSGLEKIYEPQGSGRGLSVYFCVQCGLVQSWPRLDRATRRAAAVSGDVDWGNVRYGKGFRTQASLSILHNYADLDAKLAVLDVGSNRGSFARAFLEAAPLATLTAVEPDERVASSCAGLERTELVPARIEDTHFSDASFDLIHSCHTIEHVASPMAVLRDHARVLKPCGLMVIDAPNIALIEGDDILEEWFIDKHLTHYSRATLAAQIEAAGFTIIAGPDQSDRENLLFVARKDGEPKETVSADLNEAAIARARIATYAAKRCENLAALKNVSGFLGQSAPQGVALWGAGRLFDALVIHGGFDPKQLSLLIDTHLKKHMDERHGVKLSDADALPAADPGLVVVMSRAFADEIAKEAKAKAPRANILFYADLLADARLRAAA
jgi:2-polyprenyl-3-methyl-5-hydroxy-6-metoxy-1,4-benzoquinol methylase